MPRIASRFSKGLEGWTVEGDASSVDWQPSGGNPGGFLHWADGAAGIDSYFSAGNKFLGDQSAFYQGKLSYDVYSSGANYTGAPDVQLTGGGITLVKSVGQPGVGWTHFAVALKPKGDWQVGSLDGAHATAAQIKAVLADLQEVLIRAEYVNGTEEGGLDNVVLFKQDPVGTGAEVEPRHLSEAQMQHVVDGAHDLGPAVDGLVI